MIELFTTLNCSFAKDDKKKCFSIIHSIIELSHLARREGILALEKEMENEKNFFLKTGIELIVDGTDPELVSQILKCFIISGEYTGYELLSRLVVAEGVRAIQLGENPRIIAIKLSSMLGEEYWVKITEELFSGSKSDEYFGFLRTISEKQALPESKEFEAFILTFHDREIQLIFQDISVEVIFAAIYGCGYSLVQKALSNISINNTIRIIRSWHVEKNMNNYTILACQKEILKRIEALNQSGEIVLDK